MKKIIIATIAIATTLAVNAEVFEFVTHRKEGTNVVTQINTLELNRVGLAAITANEKTIDMMVQRHSLGLGARMFCGGKALDRIIARRNRLNLPTLEEIQKVENNEAKQALLTQWVTLTPEEEIKKAEENLKQKKIAAEKAKKDAEELLKKKEAEAKALKEAEATKAKVETETKK
jgi:hypothetical protein